MNFLKIYLFIHCVYVPNDSLVGIFFFFSGRAGTESREGAWPRKAGLRAELLTLKVRPEVRLYVPEVKLVY